MNEYLSADGKFETNPGGDVVSAYEGINAPHFQDPEDYNPDDTVRAVGETDTITLHGVEYGESLAEEATQHMGELVAKEYLKNPDKFGADWPSITVLDPSWRAEHSERAEELTAEQESQTQPSNSRPDLGYMGQGRSPAADERQKQADKAFLKAQHRGMRKR
jgi:hypothetical protein